MRAQAQPDQKLLDTGHTDCVDVTPARQHFEATIQELHGRSLTGVRYWDVHDFTDSERVWDHDDWHHAVMGVDLETDRGPACVMWANTFGEYGVEAFLSPASEHLVLGDEGPETWTVTDHPRWSELIDRPIRRIRTWWEPAQVGEFPAAFRLDFDGRTFWLVAAIPDEPDTSTVCIPGDEIIVVFTAERMREIGFTDPSFTGI